MRSTGRQPRPERPVKEVLSCGGVVFNDQGRVLLLRKEEERRWCIPKGHVEPGETPQETALREIQEESGFICRIAGDLTEVSYRYYWPQDDVNYDKRVRYFLAEVVGGGPALEPGFDRLRWVTEKEALRLLHYENDKRVIREAFRRRRVLAAAPRAKG